MLQLTSKYSCMFSATEVLFHILTEYDNQFTSKIRTNSKNLNGEKQSSIKIIDTI